MVMLDLLHRSGHAGAVLHFDHGMRGDDGQKDLELVQEASKARELPFYPVRLQAPAETPEKGIQHFFREERYRWLYEYLEELKLTGIATAHQADDRLETVLMGLLRGSGFRGVMGIPTEKEGVIRPLNRTWKKRIHAYADEKGILFREDPSNRSLHYLRNRIRQELLPPFHNAFSAQEDALLRSMELLEEAGDFLEEAGEKEREQILQKTGPDEYRIPKAALKASGSPRFLLFELLRPFDIPPEQADKLLEGLEGGSGARVEGVEWALLRDRQHFILFRRAGSKVPEDGWRIKSPEELRCGPLEFEVKEAANDHSDDHHEAHLDLDGLRFPLTLRKVRSGDRFRPLGMKGGSKTVMEHLTDRKWPAHEKERALVLCDAEERVLWVVGTTIDERYKVITGSKKVLRVHYEGF